MVQDHHRDFCATRIATVIVVYISIALEVWWQCLRWGTGGRIGAIVSDCKGAEECLGFRIENAGVIKIVNCPRRVEIQCLEVELKNRGKCVEV